MLFQVQAIRSLEFYICYYGGGDFKLRQENCSKNDVYKAFFFIVAVIPYWLRFLQVTLHITLVPGIYLYTCFYSGSFCT